MLLLLLLQERKKQALWKQVDCNKVKERGSERGGERAAKRSPVIIVEFQPCESRSK